MDGDTLVYDWVTDTRLRIAGSPNSSYLFGALSHTAILYRRTIRAAQDTGWVQCTVRDRRGGADTRLGTLILYSETLHTY